MPKRKRDEDESEDGNVGAGKLRRTTRVRIERFDSWIGKIEQRVRKVTYTGISAWAGSAKVAAVLGPDSYNPRSNDADSDKPLGSKPAREKYRKAGFKAGHMLNCEFGGDGSSWKNLTILSARANTAMTKHDNALKRACAELKKFYEVLHKAGVDGSQLNCGIEVTIQVSSSKWGDDSPDCYIAKTITMSARITNTPNLNTLVQAVGALREARSVLQRVSGQVAQVKGTIVNPKPA